MDDRSLKRIANKIAPYKEVRGANSSVRLRQAEVTAVPGDGTLTIRLAADDDEVLDGIRYMNNYSTPTVGHIVFVLQVETDMIVLGRLAAV